MDHDGSPSYSTIHNRLIFEFEGDEAYRITYVKAWAGGPNAVAFDAVDGGLVDVPCANKARRILD